MARVRLTTKLLLCPLQLPYHLVRASPLPAQPQPLGPSQLRQLEREVVSSAHLVFCTLSGAGEAMRLAEYKGGFETVIFDEAAQASELSL